MGQSVDIAGKNATGQFMLIERRVDLIAQVDVERL